MSPDPPPIELELRKLKACALDDEFLARLEACAEHHDLELSEPELRFEAYLRRVRPARLSPHDIDELSELTRGAPFAADDKIVLFPKAGGATQAARYPVWQAAAAVAIIGAATAFLLPQRAPDLQRTATAAPVPPAVSQAVPASGVRNFTPASFNRGLAEARDEGIVWHGPDRTHRVLRIVYMDRVTLENSDGKLIEVEQPRVEYILVPQKID